MVPQLNIIEENNAIVTSVAAKFVVKVQSTNQATSVVVFTFTVNGKNGSDLMDFRGFNQQIPDFFYSSCFL